MSAAIYLMSPADGGALTASLDRYVLSGFTYNVPATVQTRQTTTCTASGGQAPYTYLWVYSTGDSTTIATQPSAMSTGFQRYSDTPGQEFTNYFCRVTDSLGAIFETDIVSIDTIIGGSV